MKKHNLIQIFIVFIFTSLILVSCGKKDNAEENTQTGYIQQQNNIEENNISNNDKQVDNKTILEQYYTREIGNLKCTLHMEEEGGIIDQIVYISGIKMSMNSKTNYDGKTFESNMISDGEYTYVWGNGGNFKMKIDEAIYEEVINNEDIEEENNEYGNDMKSILENIPENKCVNWNVDEEVFKVPNGIEFQDLSSFQNINEENIFETMGNQEYNLDEIQDIIPEQFKK